MSSLEASDEVAILKRTTFVLADAEKSAQFFQAVFGWKVWYDNIVKADYRFPPSGAPDAAEVRLIILEALDSKIGKLGLLQYLQPPFDRGILTDRSMIRMGEPILVIETSDVDALHLRAVEAGGQVVTAPVDWTVPTPDGNSQIRLRTISLFDPNGIYMEVSAHP